MCCRTRAFSVCGVCHYIRVFIISDVVSHGSWSLHPHILTPVHLGQNSNVWLVRRHDATVVPFSRGTAKGVKRYMNTNLMVVFSQGGRVRASSLWFYPNRCLLCLSSSCHEGSCFTQREIRAYRTTKVNQRLALTTVVALLYNARFPTCSTRSTAHKQHSGGRFAHGQ